MRVTTFAALSLFFSSGAVAIVLQYARAQVAPPLTAQDAPPPPAPETAPPPPSPPAARGTPPPAPQGTPAPAAAASAPAAPSSAVTHSNVNLRGGPGTNYALVRLIRAGSPVEVKECKHGWCQVVFQGVDGYIIERSIAPNASRTPAKRRFRPMPGYAGPPPAYNMRTPGYYPPLPYRYYYYGPYYGPYWAW
jgi:Bacterial SH3 domain